MSDDAVEREFRVASELGLHARPAGRFVQLAGNFEAEVSVGRGAEWVSGSSVLSILSLAATQGTVLLVRARGESAEEAVRAMGAVISAPNDDD